MAGPARLSEAGYDAFTIAQLMGHSDIRMAARYVRATERNKRAAVEAVRLDFQAARHKLKNGCRSWQP